jgi:predicted dinucleotide-binding enzyme
MKYATIGSGKIGTALARLFARNNTQVAIANSGGSDTLASLKEELGRTVVPQSSNSSPYRQTDSKHQNRI